jgi:hypothetical protein
MYLDNKVIAFLKENHVQKRSILIVRKKKKENIEYTKKQAI